jgi:hypothetical protein
MASNGGFLMDGWQSHKKCLGLGASTHQPADPPPHHESARSIPAPGRPLPAMGVGLLAVVSQRRVAAGGHPGAEACIPLGAQEKLAATRIGSRIDVTIGGRFFTSYRFADDEKYPFFFPLNGPSGASVTSLRNGGYPHHSSISTSRWRRLRKWSSAKPITRCSARASPRI